MQKNQEIGLKECWRSLLVIVLLASAAMIWMARQQGAEYARLQAEHAAVDARQILFQKRPEKQKKAWDKTGKIQVAAGSTVELSAPWNSYGSGYANQYWFSNTMEAGAKPNGVIALTGFHATWNETGDLFRDTTIKTSGTPGHPTSVVTVSVYIPKTAPDGEYQLYLTSEDNLDPANGMVDTYCTELFKVVRKPDKHAP